MRHGGENTACQIDRDLEHPLGKGVEPHCLGSEEQADEELVGLAAEELHATCAGGEKAVVAEVSEGFERTERSWPVSGGQEDDAGRESGGRDLRHDEGPDAPSLQGEGDRQHARRQCGHGGSHHQDAKVHAAGDEGVRHDPECVEEDAARQDRHHGIESRLAVDRGHDVSAQDGGAGAQAAEGKAQPERTILMGIAQGLSLHQRFTETRRERHGEKRHRGPRNGRQPEVFRRQEAGQDHENREAGGVDVERIHGRPEHTLIGAARVAARFGVAHVVNSSRVGGASSTAPPSAPARPVCRNLFSKAIKSPLS